VRRTRDCCNRRKGRGFARHGVGIHDLDRYSKPASMTGTMMRDARARDTVRQREGRSVASQVRDFWATRGAA
jgi:hypothetical protein